MVGVTPSGTPVPVEGLVPGGRVPSTAVCPPVPIHHSPTPHAWPASERAQDWAVGRPLFTLSLPLSLPLFLSRCRPTFRLTSLAPAVSPGQRPRDDSQVFSLCVEALGPREDGWKHLRPPTFSSSVCVISVIFSFPISTQGCVLGRFFPGCQDGIQAHPPCLNRGP